MALQKLPLEIWSEIVDLAAPSGTTDLVRLTKVSRGFRAITNPKLYQADVLESGGVKSMNYGLEKRLMDVIENCLAAGTSPNVRIYSRRPLDSLYSRTPPSLPRLEGSCRATIHYMRPDCRLLDYQATQKLKSFARTKGAEDMSEDNDFLFKKSCYWTPLHVAATRNDVELLELLLERGADPNSAGRGVCFCYSLPPRRTIYINDDEASWAEFLERTLIQRWSPLHVAVCKGQLDCAKLLIDRFGLPHATESVEVVMEEARQIIREESIRFESAFCLDTLDEGISYVDGLTPRFDPLSPMHIAASQYESVEDLERLHDMLQRAGCLEARHPHSAVDVLDAFGDTPLAVAAFSGRIQVLGGWLQSHGADVNFVLPGFHMADDGTPLFFALCEKGLYREALFLMDMGVDMNANMGRNSATGETTLLHLCCYPPFRWCNRTEAIILLRRLIDDGADIDFKDGEGRTPLISAVRRVFTAAVEVLLRAQANVGLVDHDGASALHHAVANMMDEIMPRPGSQTIVERLLDYGSDPNQCSGNTGPPLFVCQYSFGDVRDERIDDSSPPGYGPNNMASVAPLLVSRGADPNHYLEYRGDIGGGSLQEQPDDLRLRGGSLAISAFFEGEFESLDSLVACGTIVTYHDYLFMMRTLFDQSVRPLAQASRAVEALFRLLNSPDLSLGQSEDRKKIMDAWTQTLLRAKEFSWIISALTPHLALTDMNGGCEIDMLHVISYWEPNMEEKGDQFENRIREALIQLLKDRFVDVMDDNSRRSPLQNAVGRADVPVAKALIWRPFSRPANIHRWLDDNDPSQFDNDPSQFSDDPSQFSDDPSQFSDDPSQFSDEPSQFSY